MLSIGAPPSGFFPYVLLPANFFLALYLIIVKFLGHVGQALIEHFISSFLFFLNLSFPAGIAVDHFLIFHLSQDTFH